jgi:hypothetical protein
VPIIRSGASRQAHRLQETGGLTSGWQHPVTFAKTNFMQLTERNTVAFSYSPYLDADNWRILFERGCQRLDKTLSCDVVEVDDNGYSGRVWAYTESDLAEIKKAFPRFQLTLACLDNGVYCVHVYPRIPRFLSHLLPPVN